MAKSRWSKEDFDSTFEAFLKTSLSSEEDTEKIKQLLATPVKGKDVNPNALWWANDSDDDDIKKGTGKSFLKTKKSSESPVRSKSSTESGSRSFLKGKNATSKPSSPPGKQAASPKKSGRRDPQKAKRPTSGGKTRSSKSKVDTSMSKDSLEDISEKSEEHDIQDHHRVKGSAIISFNDSSIDTSASIEGVQLSKSNQNLGFDTLDEQADKERFFQNLEKEADGTVDYGILNQELSQTGGTRADLSGLSAPAAESTPARNQNVLDVTDSSQQKPSMLSRVALMDSMESTLNTTTSPKVMNSRDTTTDNLGATLPETLKNPALSGQMGTNTSREMEDLQRILQEAGDTPTIYGGDSRPATGKASNQSTTPIYEKKDVDRSVGDILKEMDAIDKRGLEIERGEDDIQLRSNYKSPRSLHSPGLHRQHPVDDLGGFDNSHTEDTEVYQPVTAVMVKERKRVDRKPEVKDKRPTSALSNTDNKIRPTRDRYSHVQSSGYGQPSSPPPSRKASRSRSAGKSPPKLQSQMSSPGEGGKEKTRKMEASTTFNIQKKPGKSPSHDKLLMESVETFARYFSEHLAANQPQVGSDQVLANPAGKPGHEREAVLEELNNLREQLKQERVFKAKLQADMVTQEREFKKELESQKLKYEDEVFSVKQENFVLAAKLKELEGDKDSKVKRSEVTSVESSTDEGGETRMKKLEREIQEQENLLAGYQAENKRLYEEIKGFQKQAKATESSMFKENQRLTAELTNVRQELEMKNTELQNKGIITSMAVQKQIAAGNAEAMMGATRIAHLEGELAEAKRVQENHLRELESQQQNKFELERHIELLVKEKDELARQLADSLKPDQVKEFEAKHKEELEKLQKKIKWYAENQELLDKSNTRLRAKDDEIHRLKMRLEDFKSEAGRKLEENKIRAKEKATDAKKIQDLERQVKEMEQVIRRRHPNSLPAMMMVAATVPDPITDSNQAKGRTVQVLEARVKKLEKDLESKDEMAQQDVRAVEQKYNHVKLQFEERIADLENQIALYRGNGDAIFKDHPHSHAVALERELDKVRDRSRKQLVEMQAEVDRLTAELNKVRKNQENMMKNDFRQTESDWRQQIQGLQRELKDREHDIKILQNTIEKMRARSGKKSNPSKTAGETKEWPPFPHAPSTSREYQPGAFADGDISTLLQENQYLKTKVDELQLELDQQRVDLRRSLAETESVARQNKERLENQIEVLQGSHQKELQRVLAEQALHSSSSRVAELQSKCDTQEIMIQHLQAQLKKVSKEAEQVGHLKARESQLQSRLDELQARLKEAKLVHAPEMRHFESLEEKLTDLVERQRKRETELDAVVKQNQQTCRAEMEEELEKWKRMVDAKNQQLQVFRAELDSILEVLRTLQRQGVTLPVGALYS